MPMKVSVFNGSPRRNGNTSELTSCLRAELSARGHTTEEYMLEGIDFCGCQNCGLCQKGPLSYCALEDGMTPLYDAFVDADLIIIASPIYMWGITGPTKAFMDRLHALNRACDPSFNKIRGKKIAFVTTMGDEEMVAASASNAIQFFCEYFGAVYKGTFAVPFATKEGVHSDLNMVRLNAFVDRLEE